MALGDAEMKLMLVAVGDEIAIAVEPVEAEPAMLARNVSEWSVAVAPQPASR